MFNRCFSSLAVADTVMYDNMASWIQHAYVLELNRFVQCRSTKAIGLELCRELRIRKDDEAMRLS